MELIGQNDLGFNNDPSAQLGYLSLTRESGCRMSELIYAD